MKDSLNDLLAIIIGVLLMICLFPFYMIGANIDAIEEFIKEIKINFQKEFNDEQ